MIRIIFLGIFRCSGEVRSDDSVSGRNIGANNIISDVSIINIHSVQNAIMQFSNVIGAFTRNRMSG